MSLDLIGVIDPLTHRNIWGPALSKIQVDEIVNSTGTGSPTFTYGAPGDISFPLRLYATTPANTALNIAPFEVTDSLGIGRASPPQVNAVNTSQFVVITTIDFQTGTVNPPGNVTITFPSSTADDYRRVGFSYSSSTGIVTATFSAASGTFGGLANVGSLFVANQRPLGWVDLQSTGGTGYKTAGSATPKIENSVSGVIRVHNFSPASSTLAVQGTTDQITVSQTGAVATLGTPQNIAATSSPTFAGITVNGASTHGSAGGNTATFYGSLAITTLQYTGSGTRTLANPFDGAVGVLSYVDNYTNLTTTPWSIANGAAIANGILQCILTNVDGDSCSFTIYGGIENGVLFRYGTSTASAGNCTISEGSEGVFSISGMGDGRTYTITCSTGGAVMTIAASSLATGTTTLKILKFA